MHSADSKLITPGQNKKKLTLVATWGPRIGFEHPLKVCPINVNAMFVGPFACKVNLLLSSSRVFSSAFTPFVIGFGTHDMDLVFLDKTLGAGVSARLGVNAACEKLGE